MDKKKKAWVPYMGVLSLLIILFIYTQYRESQHQVDIKPIFDFNTDKITSFTITKDNASVTLIKNDTSWVFPAPDTGRAQDYKIKDFIKEVLKGEREAVVTDDTSKYEKYGVTEAKATKLTVMKDETTLATILVGRSSTDYNQEFIRYENDPRVYPARQRMLNRMGASVSWWR